MFTTSICSRDNFSLPAYRPLRSVAIKLFKNLRKLLKMVAHDTTNGDHETISSTTTKNGSREAPLMQSQKQTNGDEDHSEIEVAASDRDTGQIQAKYAAERTKRLRADFDDQFVQLHKSSQFRHFTSDPWLPADGSTIGLSLVEDRSYEFKFAIQGAGFGGLLYASRLVEAGFNPKDMVLIDYAGGFGGTWYWNRYPGLMCDVAADVYMPMLEETGYMPKHKYSYGQELRVTIYSYLPIHVYLSETGTCREDCTEVRSDRARHFSSDSQRGRLG